MIPDDRLGPDSAGHCTKSGAMSESGRTRPFAVAEPHSRVTLTSRHSPRQSSRRTRADVVDVRSLYFWKNSRLSRSRSLATRDDVARVAPIAKAPRKVLYESKVHLP